MSFGTPVAGLGMRVISDDFSWRYQAVFPLLSKFPAPLAYQLASWQSHYVQARHLGELSPIRDAMLNVFPEASEADIQGWLQDYTRMVEREALDTWFINRPVINTLVRLEGFEVVQQARLAGQRVILTSGHFGRFWMAGPAMSALGHSIATMTRDGSTENKHGLHPAEHRFRLWKLQQLQRALRGPFLVEGEHLRSLYKALDSHLLTLIFDVPYTKNQTGSVTVSFLNGTIRVPGGIYKIAKNTGSVIAPFYMRDLGNRGVVAEFLDLLDPGDYNNEECMSLLAGQLEARVKANPGYWWLWGALPLLQRE